MQMCVVCIYMFIVHSCFVTNFNYSIEKMKIKGKLEVCLYGEYVRRYRIDNEEYEKNGGRV